MKQQLGQICLAGLLAFGLHSAQAATDSFDTGHVNISFDSYNSYVSHYDDGGFGGSGTEFNMPSYTIIDNGFSINPNLFVSIGNSGFYQQGQMYFNLHDISFNALSGYQITGYTFEVRGTRLSAQAGSTDLSFSPNAAITQTNNDFVAIGTLNANGNVIEFSGNMNLYAPYVQDPDNLGGPPLVSGSAEASFTYVSIRAITAPIPEPESWALFVGGLLGLAARYRRTTKANA